MRPALPAGSSGRASAAAARTGRSSRAGPRPWQRRPRELRSGPTRRRASGRRRRCAGRAAASARLRAGTPARRSEQLPRRGEFELGLDVGLAAGGADQRGLAAGAEQETDRVREDRLPRPGLPGDRVQAGVELELGLADQDEVLDAKAGGSTARPSLRRPSDHRDPRVGSRAVASCPYARARAQRGLRDVPARCPERGLVRPRTATAGRLRSRRRRPACSGRRTSARAARRAACGCRRSAR